MTNQFLRLLPFFSLLLSRPSWIESSSSSSKYYSAAAAVAAVADSNTHQERFLGSVSSKINTGRWQEFVSLNTTGSQALPCSTNCSNATNSEALGSSNPAPWTFDSPSACTKLTIVQGYTSGQTMYYVLDGNATLGNTTLGTNGTTCGNNPDACWADSKTGKGSFLLAKGSHSLRLVVAQQHVASQHGWFLLNTTECPVIPRNTTTNTCQTPLQCAKRIYNNFLCPCRPVVNRGVTTCIRKRAKNRCCPNRNDRDSDYVRTVVKKFKRLCTQ